MVTFVLAEAILRDVWLLVVGNRLPLYHAVTYSQI